MSPILFHSPHQGYSLDLLWGLQHSPLLRSSTVLNKPLACRKATVPNPLERPLLLVPSLNLDHESLDSSVTCKYELKLQKMSVNEICYL